MPFIKRLLPALLASLALAVAGLTSPVIPGAVQVAYAQVSAEFQEALEPYGHWERHPRWGAIWVPDDLPPDWRPYQYGHWVYTDDWGWYWISDPEEQDWGWVAFHYGRWAFERGIGWFWVPGDEWGPAWVDWRYGGEYVGWAPLPPDDVVYEYDDEPNYWVFVSPRYLATPEWRRYWVPRDRTVVIFRTTVVVNRTLGYGRGRAAVNAGVSPAFVARARGAPLQTFRVAPRVVASTQGVTGAMRITQEQLRATRSGPRGGRRPSANPVMAVAVQPTQTTIKATATVTAPQPLPKGERGKLGTHPPRAAQGAPPPPPLQAQPPAPQQRQPQRQQTPATTAPPAQQKGAPQQPAAPAQPQRTAPVAPSQPTPPAQRQEPPQVKPERPIVPQTPPPAVQERRPPPAVQERRVPPPQDERRSPPPQQLERRGPPPVEQRRPAEPQHVPPAAARPAQPPPQQAKPAPRPAEKKEEPK